MGRRREKLKETDKKSLRDLLRRGCTGIDIEDYCREHNLSFISAFQFISVEEAAERNSKRRLDRKGGIDI